MLLQKRKALGSDDSSGEKQTICRSPHRERQIVCERSNKKALFR
jgi:hypothetical protein